uniref:Uncharacterized protein n=1 Tax=Anguilla anguilla TaxID=7936 RepID=A0A0E9WDT4_ANGAN
MTFFKSSTNPCPSPLTPLLLLPLSSRPATPPLQELSVHT